MSARAFLLTTALLASAAPAAAQDAGRLDRIERSLREVRAIVFQGRDTGQPVVIKPAGPDPQVEALERKVGDLEQTLQRVNGQLDTTAHDLDEAKRALNDQRGAAQASADQLRTLTDRLARLEAQAAAQATAAPPPSAPPQAQAVAPPPEPSPPAPDRRARTAEATARAQSGDAGQLGAAPPAAAAPKTEAATYRTARSALAAGDYAGAVSGFQDYAARFPTGPHLADARYGLGEAYYIQDNHAEAARAYAQALRGWPKTAWAGDATLKLAQSLTQLNRAENACAAVGEFDTRYGATASAALKARAQAVRARAKCSG